MGAMRGRLLAFAIVLIATLIPGAARAWYFPEHTVLAGDGHDALAPELRAIIADVVAEARKDGLSLCERTDVRLEDALRDVPLETPMLRTPASVSCVPYASLAGLAGDHAITPAELRTLLTTAKGIELLSVVAYEWRRFRQHVARSPSTLDRMAFVHDLDVALYFVDGEYATRASATHAHFRDVGRSFELVLRELGSRGRIDEVLSQFVFHHVRSLVLAAASKRVEALLEHGFAVHFLEDAFASGHLVMSAASWAEGNDSVRLRHDAFNIDGLDVTRAMAREPCSSLATGTLEIAGLPPCWHTTGDGYLGLTPDTSDRLHATAAIARAELAFAIALDPERVVAYASTLGDVALVDLGSKVDPYPWWTASPDVRHKLSVGPKHAMRLVKAAAAAVAKLREMPIAAPAPIGLPSLPGAVEPSIIAGVLDVKDFGAITPAGADDALPADPGTSLVRPTLAQWPAAQADTGTLHPVGHLDHGWAAQIFAAAGGTMLLPQAAPVDFFGPGVGMSVGFAYRWGTLLPGRRARAIAEVSLGITETLHVDSRGTSGGSATLTLLDQELRWPVLWEALQTFPRPLDLVSIHRAGRVLLINGIRTHEVLQNGSLSFLGGELEALAVALSDGHGVHPLYAVSPELRFYLGLGNPSAAQPSFPSTLGFTFGLALTGGYATFL